MAEDEQEVPKLPTRGNKLILILVLVNFVVLGGVGAYMMLRGKGAKRGPAATEQEPTKGNGIVGPLIAMEPIIANLNDPSESRYIKLTLRLELRNESLQAAFEKQDVAVRNGVLLYLANLTWEEVRTREQKEKIAEDIRSLANEVAGRNSVRRVYFTDFVIQ